MENELFWLGLFGGWEKKSPEIRVRLYKISYTIFDIGANSGIYSLTAQSVNPDATVYTFEPIEKKVELLNYNKKINNYPILTIKAADSN